MAAPRQACPKAGFKQCPTLDMGKLQQYVLGDFLVPSELLKNPRYQ